MRDTIQAMRGSSARGAALILLLAGSLIAGKPKKPRHPPASVCAGPICINEANYFQGEIHATLQNFSDANLGQCYVRFVEKDKTGVVLAAPIARTAMPVGPHSVFSLEADTGAGFEPIEDVVLTCSGESVELRLRWPVFSDIYQAWGYARKHGYSIKEAKN